MFLNDKFCLFTHSWQSLTAVVIILQSSHIKSASVVADKCKNENTLQYYWWARQHDFNNISQKSLRLRRPSASTQQISQRFNVRLRRPFPTMSFFLSLLLLFSQQKLWLMLTRRSQKSVWVTLTVKLASGQVLIPGGRSVGRDVVLVAKTKKAVYVAP